MSIASFSKPHSNSTHSTGFSQFTLIMVLLLHPSNVHMAGPWNNFGFGDGILGKVDIFNTTVCFTIPLFSFTFPSFKEVESTCTVTDGEESCLPQEPSHTDLFKQNILGQAVFFGVTAISVASSLAFPAFLKIQNETMFNQEGSIGHEETSTVATQEESHLEDNEIM